jgi:hypothetical protein
MVRVEGGIYRQRVTGGRPNVQIHFLTEGPSREIAMPPALIMGFRDYTDKFSKLATIEIVNYSLK